MEKKLTIQIAAMYLGCEVESENGRGALHSLANNGFVTVRFREFREIGLYHVVTYPDLSSVRPILRPLSDLTEQEAREMYEIKTGEAFEPRPEYLEEGDWDFSAKEYFDELVEIYEDTIQVCIGKPDIWSYLLSRHFDLFGLIESGDAIDKTALTPNERTLPV